MNLGNKNPLVSIITVVINGEKTIEATIKSVIKAKKQFNIEYIIIDGYSTDKTLDIINVYKDEINYWISEPDNGLYDAMNKGWRIAKESYILFLGSGDEIIQLPRKLLNYSDKKIIICGQVIVNHKTFIPKSNFRLKMSNTLHHQALLVPKSACKNDPFNLSYKVYADYDLNARLLKQNYKFFYEPDFESYAMPGGVSSNLCKTEILLIIKKNFGILWFAIAFLYYKYLALKYFITTKITKI